MGDQGLFYHSNGRLSHSTLYCTSACPGIPADANCLCTAGDETGVVGIVEVVRESYADHTAFDKDDPHYDGRSSEEKPTWFMVDVKAVRPFERLVTRSELKEDEDLGASYMIKQGRVSVGPVKPTEFNKIVSLGNSAPAPKSPT